MGVEKTKTQENPINEFENIAQATIASSERLGKTVAEKARAIKSKVIKDTLAMGVTAEQKEQRLNASVAELLDLANGQISEFESNISEMQSLLKIEEVAKNKDVIKLLEKMQGLIKDMKGKLSDGKGSDLVRKENKDRMIAIERKLDDFSAQLTVKKSEVKLASK